MSRLKRLLLAVLLMPGLALPAGCQRVENPATGETQYTTLGPEEERQIGQEQHPAVLQQFGGAYDDPELQAYVEQVGNRIVEASDTPDAEFTFTLLNANVVNAFALPGGYVYITRGLLALAETEAEMASVLGHEIGHVTARHSAQRQTRGVFGQLGQLAAVLLGGYFGGETGARLGAQVGGVGAQAWIAGYSREQEYEADDLGIRYLTRAGYDPRAAPAFLQKLQAKSELERELAGGGSEAGLSWFATHPQTLDRVERAAAEAAEAAEGEGRIGRDAFLDRIDGMLYGEDPAQGFVRGRQFVHPELGFAFEAPAGFQLVNTPQAVLARDREGRQMVFTGANLQGRSLEAYVAGPGLQQVAQLVNAEVSRPRNVATFEVNGMPAASASATVRQGNATADIGLAVIDTGERAYQFIFISPETMGRAEARAFQATVESFQRISRADAQELGPLRIRVVTVEQGEDAGDLARRMAVDEAPEAHFRLLNALALEDGLEPGERVKLVVQ